MSFSILKSALLADAESILYVLFIYLFIIVYYLCIYLLPLVKILLHQMYVNTV